jgi:PAS domain S-box-containing protein
MDHLFNDLDFFGPAKNYELYQRIIGEIQDYAIILLDKNGIIRNWNIGAEKIKGYGADEVIGKHFSIFYFPENIAEDLPNRLLRIAETEGRSQHEGWRRRKDGTGFWGSITVTALHGDDRNVIGYVKVTRDLTERKRVEDSLRMSEERYHQMVAEVQDYAIILLSEDGIVENWNAGAEKIKGYSAAEIVGKRFDLFYTEEDRASGLPDRLLQQARNEGKALQEGWRVRKDGTKFWGTIVITALHDKHNHVIGFSKVTRDLTEKKIAEEQLRAYAAELEIQNRELEQFAYVASHDLQEPLRKIRVFTGLIRENFSDEAFVQRYLNKLESSAKHMSLLIHSLLNFTRLTRHRHLKETTDLNDVLETVLEDMELLIKEKQAVVTNDPLPTVAGYRVQLEQLFSNLINNSLKFSGASPEIRITCSIAEREDIENLPDTAAEDRYLSLSFIDNGIGFEQQYNESIFLLFHRLHEKHQFEGTGIGLSLCKKIAENHNGFITAEGRPGNGAQFNVFLPCRQQEGQLIPVR